MMGGWMAAVKVEEHQVGSNTTRKERDFGDRQLQEATSATTTMWLAEEEEGISEVMWERVISMAEEGKAVAASRAAATAEGDGVVGSDYSSKRREMARDMAKKAVAGRRWEEGGASIDRCLASQSRE
ncbi:hypothetical protein B296_00011234 [Ensete ventricosum]|uniref:Uncharacterized protein n=1 Tax=Ensete ventricosum TaxID=4639 RepID=A0A426ZML6_ENSVE|nr:hypothetical protein B296_00011234 [Ensete ventricosum]